MRLFFAVKAPEHEIFNKAHDQLKDLSGDIKPVLPSLHHITLKFLGEIKSSIEDVLETAEKVKVGIEPFTMRPSGAGAFPHWDKASVMWIGLEPEEKLGVLAADLDRELNRELGTKLEKRRFRAHITIARRRSRSSRPGFDTGRAKSIIENAEEELRASNYNVPVNSFTLFSSTLTPSGPIYKVVRDIPLEH